MDVHRRLALQMLHGWTLHPMLLKYVGVEISYELTGLKNSQSVIHNYSSIGLSRLSALVLYMFALLEQRLSTHQRHLQLLSLSSCSLPLEWLTLQHILL